MWRLSLEQPATLVRRLSELLSPDEQTRAARFYFEGDRRRFIVGRGALRLLLGHYLGSEPDQLRFCYHSVGKPYLSANSNYCDLRFNLAHSGELAVYAFALRREVGIDVEYIRSLPDGDQIAARFFSTQENADLSQLPEKQRRDAFFSLWTRKEACVKAIGDGLSHPLDQFQVSYSREDLAQWFIPKHLTEEPTRWSLKSCVPAPGYVAALAIEGVGCCLECWQCQLAIGQASAKPDLIRRGELL